MMRILWVSIVAATISAASGQDIVRLKTGESTACKVTAITDNIVTFTLPPVRGSAGGSAKRTLPMDRVDYVEFGFQPGEKAVYDSRDSLDVETIEKWWNAFFGNLHRPRSRTAAYGVALGHALLRDDSPGSDKRALALFDRIIERAWSDVDVSAAKQGRLQSLIAIGDLETAVAEASLLATQTEDPELLIEVKFLLSEADFKRLKTLEEENPRWEEDEEVRPERNRLFHRVVDQYLWAHLFHATRVDAASRGLLSAGGVYEFAGEAERARASYTDLVALYPDTESAGEAETRLQELSEKSNPSNEKDTP